MKETRIKKETVDVLQQASYRIKIGMMKLLALTLYLLARITLTLISLSVITGCFQKVKFQGFNLVILNFELPSAFLYASCELFEQYAVLCGNNSILLKIRDSLLYVTNLFIKVTSKLIFSSVSRFKFCPPYKIRE